MVLSNLYISKEKAASKNQSLLNPQSQSQALSWDSWCGETYGLVCSMRSLCNRALYNYTMCFFFKFVSLASNSKTYWPNEFPRIYKIYPLKGFWKKTHPKTPHLLSRSGPRWSNLMFLNITLVHFLNSERKKILAWKNELSAYIEWI